MSVWGRVFGFEILTTATLDRVFHHCEAVSINGSSCRLKAIERDDAPWRPAPLPSAKRPVGCC
ncbi:ATP-binding protein [Actinacidiphila alni]|uniref:ATP-binding protein n=1 Tax=Actinacidiphila alni TaxID=380248 RepID=UPI003453F288